MRVLKNYLPRRIFPDYLGARCETRTRDLANPCGTTALPTELIWHHNQLMNKISYISQNQMTIRRRTRQHGAGIGFLLPILTQMLGGSGRTKRRRRMMTRTIRRRLQKG